MNKIGDRILTFITIILVVCAMIVLCVLGSAVIIYLFGDH